MYDYIIALLLSFVKRDSGRPQLAPGALGFPLGQNGTQALVFSLFLAKSRVFEVYALAEAKFVAEDAPVSF